MTSRVAGACFLVASVACALGGCSVRVPSGVFACDDRRPCPIGFRCHADGLCYSAWRETDRDPIEAREAGAPDRGRVERDATADVVSTDGSSAEGSSADASSAAAHADAALERDANVSTLPDPVDAGRTDAAAPDAGTRIDSGMIDPATPPQPCDEGFERRSDGGCSNIDDCVDDPCTPGTCADGVSAYTCSCPAGYASVNGACENVDDCPAGNPCAPGSCVDGVGSYRCECPTGFASVHGICQNISDCPAMNPCAPGSCVDGVNGYHCSCPVEYREMSGRCVLRTEIVPCPTPDPCGPPCRCRPAAGDYECIDAQGLFCR